MEAFQSNAASSQGSEMMREASEHNDAVRARNQIIIEQLNVEKAGLDGQKRVDKILNDVKDVYGTSNAIKSSYQTYKAAQQAGGFVKYVQGEGGVGNIKRQYNSVGNFVKNKIYGPGGKPTTGPQEFEMQDLGQPKPAPNVPRQNNLNDTANEQGTAADAPVKPADVEPGGSTKAGTAASNVGTAANETSEEGNTVGKLVNGAADTADKVGKGLAAVGAITDIAEDIKDGKIAGDNTADKVGNVTSIAAGALDVASFFLPFLAPVAAATSAVAAVSGGIGEIEDITNKKTQDAKDAKSAMGKTSAPVSLTGAGLVASSATDNTKSISGSTSF